MKPSPAEDQTRKVSRIPPTARTSPENPHANDILALAARGLKDVLREICELPDSSIPERNYKRKRFDEELKNLVERISRYRGHHSFVRDLTAFQAELVKQNDAFLDFIRKEEERLQAVRRIQNGFKTDIDSVDRLSSRVDKILAYQGLAERIEDASRSEKDGGVIGVTREDLAGLLLRVQNSLHAVQGEELAEELRNIIEEDREDKPAKEVLAEITEFLKKLQRGSPHEELLGQAQEFKQAIQKQVEEKVTKKQRDARAVLHTAVNATAFLAEALNTLDHHARNEKLVEALRILREGIVDENGESDTRKIEALRRHFGQSTDPLSEEYIAPDPIRRNYLEKVIANPKKVVTIENVDDFMKDESVAVRDKRTPEKKYEELLEKRSACIDEPTTSLRLEMLDSLLRLVMTTNSQDKKFAGQFGEGLISSINRARDRTNSILQDDFKNRPQSELEGGLPVNQLLDEKFGSDEPYHSPVKKQSKLLRKSLLLVLAVAGGTLAYRERSRFLQNEDPTIIAPIPSSSSAGTSSVGSSSVGTIPSSLAPENREQNRKEAIARLSASLNQRLNPHQLTLEQCQSARVTWEAEPESSQRAEEVAIWSKHERRLLVMEKAQVVIRRLEAGERLTTSEVSAIIGTGPEDSVLTDLTRDLEQLTR